VSPQEVTPESGSCEERLYAAQVAAEELQRVNDVLRGQVGGVLDRGRARAVLADFWGVGLVGRYVDPEPYLDRLAACVRPATIDRDALAQRIYDYASVGVDDESRLSTAISDANGARDLADQILALVRPAAGVTITPEEAAAVLDMIMDNPTGRDDAEDQRLIRRLGGEA
jgi:hypothetical protein